MTQSGSTTPENQMAGGNALVSEPASYSFNSDDTFKGMYGEVVSSSGGDATQNPLQDGGRRRRRRTKKRTMKRKAKKSGKSKKARKSRSNKKRGRRTRRR